MDLIEKFEEIVPYKASYDKNMFKFTMQDGNIVYTNLNSIKMLSKYQSVLTKLKGQSVCLVLDSTHSTIEKVNCEDLNSKKKEEFLTITRTETYQFQDVEGKRSFSCYNHNAFLNMMDGALSGKTGFTSDAGYCYVGALRRDVRTFIVALLACGWPNNKSYKWSDMRTLMTYALDHYQYKTFEIELPVRQIFINNGIKARSDTIDYPGKNGTKIPLTANLSPVSFLLKEDETISVDYEIPDQLDAPVRKGMQVGRIRCTLNDKLIREYPVYTTQNAEKRSFKKCVEYIFHLFSIQNSYQKAGNIKKDQVR